MFICTVHPIKNDAWWPTVLTVEIAANDAASAKAKARGYAMFLGMKEPRKIVVKGGAQ